MRSHTPVRGQNMEAVMRYISTNRDVLELSKKRKFNCGGDQGSHGENWERSGGHGIRNSEG